MEPLAIVGLSFKLPQDVEDEESLWDVLESRRNLMTEWPENRARTESFHSTGNKKLNTVCHLRNLPSTMFTFAKIRTLTEVKLHARGAHFIREDPAVFDAPFFSITAKEAAAMDPQHRWALETAFHAFENAGMPFESLRGSDIAVFAASMLSDYHSILLKDPDTMPQQATTGTVASMLANRLSWYFDLRGPSVHIDTACSSSMTALDMACQAIRGGDSSASLVVGTNLLLNPEMSLFLSNMNFLSPSGRSFSFDSRADGYGRGEGIVAIIIKSLDDALRDGDVIRAVIRSSASNQDGRTPGLTQPSADAQEALIRRVYAKAGLTLDKTRYFEAHGTGTSLGDPIETTALGKVFGAHRSPEDPLLVGSIKANIGHLEGASGLAGIAKCIMVLEKGVIPPNALLKKMNPAIDATSLHLQIPLEKVPWPSAGLRRISVNSFGFGGANSHVILDDAFHFLSQRGLAGHHNTNPTPTLVAIPASSNGTTNSLSTSNDRGNDDDKTDASTAPKLLIWTAADESGLQRVLRSYARYYHDTVSGNSRKLARLAYTLIDRRSVMAWRAFAVLDGTSGDEGESVPSIPTSQPVRASVEGNGIVFVFTGQGAQYAGMGLALVERYAVFSQSLERSNFVLKKMGCKWTLLDELGHTRNMHRPDISQPLCTILQVALVDLLRSFGLSPAAVVGHSSGELAAAYAAGVLSHESVCKMAYVRGKLVGKLFDAQCELGTMSSMMSVNLTAAEVPQWLDRLTPDFGNDTVHVACFNSANNLTLSGSANALHALKLLLDEEGIFAQIVHTGIAYHSPAMRTIASEYLTMMTSLDIHLDAEPNGRRAPMISTVTGTLVSPKLLATPRYWVDNLVSPVLFVQALQRLVASIADPALSLRIDALSDFVEIGPHGALQRPVRDCLFGVSPAPRYHSMLHRSQNPILTTLSLLGELFCRGYAVSLLQANGQCRGELAPLVDCPPYPFDHSRRYWSESRISSDFRFRKGLSGHMLGRRSNDWNTLQPRWRSWLCTETMPWLGDHVVSDTTLCPGVGLVIMALEAVKQFFVADDTALRGFHIKEAHFIAPIPVGTTADDATETELHLRRIQTAYEKSATWCEARIFSYHSGRWTECFYARIQIQLEQTASAPTPVDGGRETRWEQQRIRNCVEQAHSACSKSIGSQEFYNYCAAHGNRYGESFKLLENVAWDGHDISVARIDMTATIFHEESLDSPVHPTVLDAAMQLLFTQISRGLTGPMPALVPYKVMDTWISSRAWDKTTSTVRISSVLSDDLEFISRRKGTIYAIADDGMPLCAIESVILSEVSNPERVQDAGNASHDLLYSIAWKPQFSSLAAGQLQKLYNQKNLADDEEAAMVSIHQTFERAMQRVVKRSIQELAESDLVDAAAHIRKYWAYLKQQSSSMKELGPLSEASGEKQTPEDLEIESLLAEYEQAEPQWRLLPAVARVLPHILRGQIDPLEFLFSSDLARQFYLRLYSRHMHDNRFRSFLELITHENPSLRILEIGAGTGGFTRQILDTLQHLEQQTGQRLFAEYVYTDISPAFFEQAQAEFPAFANRMTFRTLNIDKPPLDQGFECARFDVVIAGCVLHATPDLAVTLRNTHKLLKPGALLVLEEITCSEKVSVNVGFGCLEGWWLSTEDWRQNGPLLTDRQWHDLLQDTGLFSGAEVTLRDFESDECHVSSIIVTRAVATKGGSEGETCHDQSHRQDHVIFLIDEHVAAQRTLASLLVRKCVNSHISHIGDILDGQWSFSPEDIIVFLVEVGRSYLAQMTETAFKSLQALVERNDRILWVVALPATGVLMVDPHCALATGLLRSIRSEQSEKHIVTLVIESGDPDPSTDEAVHVEKVLQSCFLHQTANSSELEFVVRDGQLNIGRLVQELELDSQRLSRTHARMRKEPWSRAAVEGQPLVLRIGTPGMLDTMHFVEDVSRDNTLGPEEVEIEASVWPLGFHDIFVALGRLPEQELGIECAGRVKRVGLTSSARFKPGDRVMMFAPGCMRSHPRAPADSVIKIPDDMSMHDAVSILNPLMTAYHSLVNVARLQCGERVLIHAAAGGTGQMAVAVAQNLGAQVFVTVGSEEKKQLMINHFGIPEHHIFYSRDASFSQGIRRVAGNVHVVLNSLSGDMLRASWECIAPYGRFIEIGKTDIIGNSSLPMAHFAKNVMFAAVDLYHIALTDKPLGRQLIEVTLQLLGSGDVRPPSPLHLFPVSKTEKAFRYMQSGKNTGRVMITVSDEDVVPKLLVDKTAWRFDPKASYLVAGGLGGIGRATMRWMASRGARHLISPSRHGISSQAAADVVSELEGAGVQVAIFQCDVSSAPEVSRMLESLSDMPPVRGCINAVMVLQDSVFSNMTHAQWTQTIRSKVNASWNLHSLLPRDMNFFILLSSLGGVYGSPGQSNYAAGCAFQDALAAERTAAGLAGSVSLDLGWMRTIGIVAETDRYRQSGNHIYVSQPVEEADYLAVLEHYCDPGLRPLDRARSQLLVGAVQPAGCYAAGETPSPMLSRPLFSGFAASRSTRKPTVTEGSKGEDLATLFVQAAGSKTQRCKIVMVALRTKLARALGVQADDLDHRKSLSDYGVDSLMAVELRNWIRRDFRASVTVFEMMGGASMAQVGELVAERAVE